MRKFCGRVCRWSGCYYKCIWRPWNWQWGGGPFRPWGMTVRPPYYSGDAGQSVDEASSDEGGVAEPTGPFSIDDDAHLLGGPSELSPDVEAFHGIEDRKRRRRRRKFCRRICRLTGCYFKCVWRPWNWGGGGGFGIGGNGWRPYSGELSEDRGLSELDPVQGMELDPGQGMEDRRRKRRFCRRVCRWSGCYFKCIWRPWGWGGGGGFGIGGNGWRPYSGELSEDRGLSELDPVQGMELDPGQGMEDRRRKRRFCRRVCRWSGCYYKCIWRPWNWQWGGGPFRPWGIAVRPPYYSGDAGQSVDEASSDEGDVAEPTGPFSIDDDAHLLGGPSELSAEGSPDVEAFHGIEDRKRRRRRRKFCRRICRLTGCYFKCVWRPWNWGGGGGFGIGGNGWRPYSGELSEDRGLSELDPVQGMELDPGQGMEDRRRKRRFCRRVCRWSGCYFKCIWRPWGWGGGGGFGIGGNGWRPYSGELSEDRGLSELDPVQGMELDPGQGMEDRRRKRKFCRRICHFTGCYYRCIWRPWGWGGGFGIGWKPYSDELSEDQGFMR